ncbi:MAG: signal peptidase [Armatimonadetes bacterium]|jgi:signal peptidase I|nr:signal peptidase [Armatimonadota bacterium]
MQEATTFPCNDVTFPEARPLSKSAIRPSLLKQSAGIVVKALLLFAIFQGCVMQGYKVYGSCMEPNLFTGERLLGNKLALFEGVKRGDVVVFRPPHKPNTAFVKRVIGLPGEVVEIRNSQVYVNHRRLSEPYLHRLWHDDRAPERVPADMVFVLGDNRDNSNDSRMWGELPINNIQAKAYFRYWPLARAGWIR